MTQFWVISRKTYIAGAYIAAGIVLAAAVVFLLGVLFSPESATPNRQRRSDGGEPIRVLAVEEAIPTPRRSA